MTTGKWQPPLTLEDRLAELTAARAELMDALKNTPAELDTGASERWSVAEIVYHLHLTEKSIIRILQKSLGSGTRHARASDDSLRAEWERIRSLIGIRDQRASAPPGVVPTGAPALTQAVALLDQSRQALLTFIGTVSLNDLASVSMPHPFEVIGTVTGAGWLSIIAQHELRHAEQIREIISRHK